MTPEIVNHLLSAPDTQLDASMKPLIQKWSVPPAPLELLEVLDFCINGSLASGFVVTLLQIYYKEACAQHGLDHEEVAKQAPWRKSIEFK